MNNMSSEQIFSLNKRQLQALISFASKDAARINLSAVCFGEDCAIATDGHTLLVYGRAPLTREKVNAATKSAPALVSAKALKAFASSMEKGDLLNVTAAGVYKISGGRAPVDVSVVLPLLAGVSFPPAGDVVPWELLHNGPSAMAMRESAVRVNADYLARCAEAIDVLHEQPRSKPVEFYLPKTQMDPILATATCFDDGVEYMSLVVVMPVRR